MFTIVSVFILAIVNYIDEYLTAKNPAAMGAMGDNSHRKVGGLLIISTLMNLPGAVVAFLFVGSIATTGNVIALATVSAIAMVTLWASYFYLITRYSVYLVVPLCQLTSLWLLIIEIITNNGSLSLPGIIGVVALIIGSYLLDLGEFKWKIPGRLFLTMLPVTFVSAAGLYAFRIASDMSSGPVVAVWHLFFIGIIGIVLVVLFKDYRAGFLIRVKEQGRIFIGLSLVNESISMGAYFLSNLAIAIAPAVAYVSALSGLQGVFILILFIIFPQKKEKITAVQIFAIVIMALAVYLIEKS